jgi:hypothetical protein
MDVIELVKKNGVSLVCPQSHSTHRLQPWDVSVIALLKLTAASKSNNGQMIIMGLLQLHIRLLILFSELLT